MGALTGSLLTVTVDVGFGTLNVEGNALLDLNPSTTTVPSLTSRRRCVLSESLVNLAVKGFTT